jgi:transposase
VRGGPHRTLDVIRYHHLIRSGQMVKCNNDQVSRLKRTLKREKNPTVRQRIQMVLLRENGMTQPEIAEAMGVSLSTVNRAHMAYDHGGRKALEPKPIGGRMRENMTLAEEKALLDRFAKAAGAGEMLNIHDLKAAYEEAIGHPTSYSTVYNLLGRHDWRKLMPRPFHPDRDIQAQVDFKKRAFQRLSGKPGGSQQNVAVVCGSCLPMKLVSVG